MLLLFLGLLLSIGSAAGLDPESGSGNFSTRPCATNLCPISAVHGRPHYIKQEETDAGKTSISVAVNTSTDEKHYGTYVASGGILLGALKRLQFTSNFIFTYVEFQDYGPYLNCVNGLCENKEKHTYWQLLVKKPDGSIIPLNVGIGCYIPHEGEEIILNYTTWS